MNIKLDQTLTRVAEENFATLAFLLPVPEEEVFETDPDSRVAVRVSFTGPLHGALFVAVSAEMLPELTGNMLGLIAKIRVASRARFPESGAVADPPHEPRQHDPSLLRTTHKILAIGASTGGTKAIETVLLSLPGNTPGTVIVQHMPERFTAGFAERLDQICTMEVREAKSGDLLVPGLALIAPGNYHMALRRSGARYSVQVKTGPPVHHQRPSVDVLFHSVAKQAGANSIATILTGMGSDGARGLLAMRQAGARTFAQNEDSCVVFGMPKGAIKLEAAEKVLALNRMAGALIEAAVRESSPAAT